MRKYLLQIFAIISLLITNVEFVCAHEFDGLGILVRHKANKVSLIAAPPLATLKTDENGKQLDFDSNSDGIISFQEIRGFENEIAKRIEKLVVFRDGQGLAAKVQSVRILEKGYENLLKIVAPDDKNSAKTTQKKKENDQATYIQLSLKFQWDKQPQAIYLHYGLLTDDKKHVLVRDQNIRKSHVIVLESSEPAVMIFPITSDNTSNTKAIWVLGIEHVLAGLDHLLFILALVLVCKSPVGLVVPLSAFTLAHSLAMVLVAFGIEMGVPSRLIEAGIAITIVIMALFELFGWKPKKLFLVTAIMGGIHGLGLGQALTDSLGKVEGWAIALVQVTVGIELAQLAVALLFLTILIHLSKLNKANRKKIEFYISSVVVCVGIFWMVERLLS